MGWSVQLAVIRGDIGVRAAGPVSWAVGVWEKGMGGGGTPLDFVHTG